MMVKKTHVALNNTSFVLIMCLIISSHFTSENQAEITSCQHHLRPWNFLVLSMNTGILPVRSSSALDTNKHTRRHKHTLLLLIFFFHHVLSLLSFSSVIMLLKKTQLFQISLEFRHAFCNFLTEQQWTRTSVDFPLYSYVK